MQKAKRLEGLSSAIFAEIDVLKDQVAATGKKIINLGIGSPDKPPATHIQQALAKGIDHLNNYGYPTSKGSRELRDAISFWYKNRFAVDIDPESESLVLMGSQDGLGHLPLGFLNNGDIALVPDPGYPVYSAGVKLAGGTIYPLPLVKEKGFLPELNSIPPEIAKGAKMMILNYPNNPVAAVANYGFFKKVVEFAQRYEILVCHDFAYSELAFDGYKPMSFLETPGAKEVGVEFHSVSKTYNMAGCRLGFVVGNKEAIQTLACIKSNIDYGVFMPVQEAGIAALTGPQDIIGENVQNYLRRRDTLIEGLAKIGWQIEKPLATMFVWAPLPGRYKSSVEFAKDLLHSTGIVVVPGVAFGEQGEGYVRIALVQEEELIREAVSLIASNFNFS